MRAAAVAESEMTGSQLERFAGEARVNRRGVTLPRYGLKLRVCIVSEGDWL
jgi:hypothetical protein